MISEEEVVRIFPAPFRERFRNVAGHAGELQEIRFGVLRPVRVILAGGEKYLEENGALNRNPERAWRIGEKELDDILQYICRYSLYAFEEEISQGFITIPGGHRVGLAGQVIQKEDGKIKNLKYIRFMNIRISHEILGAADGIMNAVYENRELKNTLIIAPPGCGKTTMLRDLIRQVSDGNSYGAGRQVGVVDERSEIAGSFMGIPQNNVGTRTDVMDACPKVQGMMMLVRSMSPRVVAVDEIGGKEDMRALWQVLLSGSKILATIHGESLEDITARTFQEEHSLENIFERFIILKKENGRCLVKAVYGSPA